MAKTDERIAEACHIIAEWGGLNGVHHKQWVLDQVLRTLLGKDGYRTWVEERESFMDARGVYDGWDTGIAP